MPTKHADLLFLTYIRYINLNTQKIKSGCENYSFAKISRKLTLRSFEREQLNLFLESHTSKISWNVKILISVNF